MTRDQIISALFTGKNFNDCIGKMEPAHIREDLKMEAISTVCEWPDDKVVGLHEQGKLEFYVVRVIVNMLTNKYSPFFKRYRSSKDCYDEQGMVGFFGATGEGATLTRHLSSVVEQATDSCMKEFEDLDLRQQREDAEDRALDEIDNLYWYNAEMVRLYQKHGNYRAIQAETGIPFISCYKTIQKSFGQLKQIANK